MRWLYVLMSLFVVSTVVTPTADAQVEATSLLGRELTRPELADETIERHEKALATLVERLRAHPDDADARIWLGRHLGYLGRYREAAAAFTAGHETFPDDARFLRHRGHRYITLRRFDDAIRDFEAGLTLIAGKPDLREPDGLPNLFNQPTGTLKTNLWYHLGLARYLTGDFVAAGEAFTACAGLADNDDMLVAASYWLYLSLVRQSRADAATSVLARAPLDAPLIENTDYQVLLRVFAGRADDQERTYDASSVSGATVAYGMGALQLATGQPEQAIQIFEVITNGTSWAAFGHIAAEAELARAK
ncbi:MAG: tetratricopeptide repeat protein [Acidobacteriota bacterium]